MLITRPAGVVFAIVAIGAGISLPAGADCRPGIGRINYEVTNTWKPETVPDADPDAVDFRAACAEHTACYGVLGRSKRFCDRTMQRALLRRCTDGYEPETPEREACIEIVNQNGEAVTDSAAPAYRSAQRRAKQKVDRADRARERQQGRLGRQR